MYEPETRGPGDAEPVGAHGGTCQDFLERHRREANRAVGEGVRGVRALAPALLSRIGDSRMLRQAWDYLSVHGGQAPGPDGMRYRDVTNAEAWDLCRTLGQAIRDGTYYPGPERVVNIAKDSGRGQRQIVLLNAIDRVAQRATTLVLQPLLNPLFDPRSFGFRPALGRLHALAEADRLAMRERRLVWVTEDVRDAFCHVPVSRLLQVVEKLLPAADLLGLLERVVPARTLPGLRQGGSLSPLMLNVYLNHVLDRPWRRDRPGLPLVRVADDLLALCRSRREAATAREALHRLLLPAGMPLKGTATTAVRNLAGGESADWLGLTILRPDRRLVCKIGRRSWNRLDRCLALAHTKPDPPLRAFRLVGHWLDHQGPCYAASNRERVLNDLVARARAHAFEEVPDRDHLIGRWQLAYTAWRRWRAQARAAAALK